MSKYDDIINVVLSHEGGFSNNPLDPGGPTNFGITLKFLQSFYDELKISKKATPSDIANLIKKDAIKIYKIILWDKGPYEKIKHHEIASKLFDMSVLMGKERASILLQQAINECQKIQIKVDGIIGLISLNCINSIDTLILLSKFKLKLIGYILKVIKNKSSSQIFMKGWTRRINS